MELSSTFQPARSTGVAPRLVTSNQSAPYGLSPLAHGAASVTTTPAGTGVTVSVNGALVASGVVPTLGSSTVTETVKLGQVSAVPAFRYRPVESTSKEDASGPVTLNVLAPTPSSATLTSATFTRAAVLAFSAIEPVCGVSVTAVGAAFGPEAAAYTHSCG